MKAEIISIGSELTSGQNLDTNSQWLSRELAEIGIRVHWHTTIADDLEENVEAIGIACRRADLVIATGGLGPTQDDLTREAVAKVAGVELELDPAALEAIEQLFAARGRTMPPRNRSQAFFPKGARIVPNARGSAPGFWVSIGTSTLVALPGVPSEMIEMFQTQVRPALGRYFPSGQVLVQKKINCFGAGESAVEERLLDLTRRGHEPEVGITVSDATISLRILARAPTADQALATIRPVEATIRERLGSLVFGEGDEELHDIVIRELLERRLTVATAESVTAGQVAERLGRVPGASGCLLGGVVAYHNDVKMKLLGVTRQMLDDHGAVSAPVAETMARTCRELFGADFALSTTGIAGPSGATPTKPVGLVFAALAWAHGTKVQQFSWGGTRTEVQSRSSKMALNLLRLRLLETKSKP
jgi:competence/damage-inducible protein CinA-like protein